MAEPGGTRTPARSPLLLWIAFLAVQGYLALLCLIGPIQPLGDVTSFYSVWSRQALAGGPIVGVDLAWVYPILALVPMVVTALVEAVAAGGAPAVDADAGGYASAWLGVVIALNAVAFATLIGVRTVVGAPPRRVTAAWWWIGFALLLGPIALGRIDTVTVALGVIAVTLVSRHPAVAATLLSLAVWTKVWPAALVGAALIALRERGRIVIVALAVSAVVGASVLALGGGENLLGFVWEQTGRSLQVEAPVSTAWLWLAVAGAAGSEVFYDQSIASFGVSGTGAGAASAVMTPVLGLVVLVVAVLGVRAARAGAAPAVLLAPLALAFTAALIAFNKVGSPQFTGWLAVPVVLGLIGETVRGREPGAPSFRFPATVSLVLAVLTQVIYPFFYLDLLALDPAMVLVLTVRNALEFVLLGWAVTAVVRAGPVRWADQSLAVD